MSDVYKIKVLVEYEYEIEADSLEEAEAETENFSGYPYNAYIITSSVTNLSEEGEV